MITDLANKLTIYIQSILTENNVEADVIVDYVPEYELSELQAKKVIIIPTNIEYHDLTRGFLQKNYTYEIGILQRLNTESELAGIIDVTETIGASIKGYHLEGHKCMECKVMQLYNPADYANAKKVISVLQATFKEYRQE